MRIWNFLLFHQVWSLYEDQIDEFDWLQENIGYITDIQTFSTTPKYLYVQTKANTLSKLTSRTGEIKWRHVFASTDVLDQFLLTSDGIFTLSNEGQLLRSWDSTDGTVRWDFPITTIPTIQSQLLQMDLVKPGIAVLTSDGLRRIDTKHQRIKWHFKDDWEPQQLLQDLQGIHVLVQKGKDRIWMRIHKDTGEKELEQAVDIDSKLQYDVDGVVVEMTPSRIATALQVTTATWSRSSDYVMEVMVNGERKVCVVQNDGKIKELPINTKEVYHVGKPIGDVEPITVIGVTKSGIGGKILNRKNGKEIWSSKSMTMFESISEIGTQRGALQDVFPVLYKRKDDTFSARLVLGFQDESIMLVKEKQQLWLREEGLASIIQAEWVTLSDSSEKLSISHIPSFTESLALQIKQLQQSIQSFRWVENIIDGLTNTQTPEKSHFFGFSKLIIALTKSNKLYALHSETGTVAWSIFLGQPYRLVVTRDHPGLGIGPELLLISKTTSTKALWIDADTGNTIDEVELKGTIRHAFLLPMYKHHLASDGQASGVSKRVVGFVDDKMQIHLVPNTAASIQELEEHRKDFYFRIIDSEANHFHGYKITQEQDAYVAQEVWKIALPKEETIITIQDSIANEVIDSPVTITGDDSLLLKYLNPHLFCVITHHANENVDIGMIYLIDTVSGRLVHRMEQKHLAPPVNVVLMENTMVYSFWNSKSRRTEMTSVALFDGAINSHGLHLWKRPYWPEQFSSFTASLPIVLQKGFVYPTGIRAMAPTKTAQGITPKHLLIAMETGQVYSLPLRLIDPRRPDTQPTTEQQSEGLMQYFPYVPVYNNPLAMVSYNKTIAKAENIITTRAALESSSLAFMYGLDLFYVRVTPAKAFDLLPADFNYALLLLLVIGLALATLIMRTIVRRKKLHDAWK